MAIFSRLSTKLTRTVDHLSVMTVKTKAKIRRDRPRGAIMLSAIKVSATVACKLWSSVPYMQGIVDAANEVVAYAETTKSNRKECKELAALVEELVWGLLAETEGAEEDDLGERARLNLAEYTYDSLVNDLNGAVGSPLLLRVGKVQQRPLTDGVLFDPFGRSQARRTACSQALL